MEEATDAEVTAKTLSGGTGARLFATLVQLGKSISLKALITTTTDVDEFVVNQWGEDKRISQTNIREQLAADTSKKWTSERATNTETIVWLDDTRYVTPLWGKTAWGLVKNWTRNTISATSSAWGWSDTSASVLISESGLNDFNILTSDFQLYTLRAQHLF